MTARIDEMFAYVMEEDGGEGVMAFHTPEWGWMPMVGADCDRMLSMRPLADGIARAKHKPYKLLRFSTREDVTRMLTDSASRSDLPGGT